MSMYIPMYADTADADDRLLNVPAELARVRKIVTELDWETWGDPSHALAADLKLARRDLERLQFLSGAGVNYVPRF